MAELRCLNCDSGGLQGGLVLTDERADVPVVLAAWCDEACMGEWLVKNALEAMMKRMMTPSAN